MLTTLDFFNKVTADSDKPCIQYIGDNGKVARRGYWTGGIHIWEKLKSKGEQHMCTGPVPVGKNQVAANGLRVGETSREFDELRAGLMTLEKVEKHWQIPNVNQPYLAGIDWTHDVICGRHLLIDRNRGLQIFGKEIPEQDLVCYFKADKLLAEMLSSSELHMQWHQEINKAILGFDTISMGGMILAWDCSHGGKELIETTYQGKPIKFRRDKNVLTKEDNEMKVVSIPANPAVAAPKPEPEEKAPEKVEKKPVVKKPAVETPDIPGMPEKPATPEKAKKPFEGLELDGLLEALEAAVFQTKEAIHPMVGLLKAISKATKNSASSNEVKSLKAEVKELRTKNKQLEAELDKKTKALKLLVSGDKF